MPQEDDGRTRRIAIISLCSILLVSMVVAVTVGVNLNHLDSSDPKNGNKFHEVSDTMKAVESICQPTDYKQDCIKTLYAEAGQTTDPKELMQTAFKVAMERISEGAKKSTVLHELEKDPRAKQALDNCKELLDSAIAELKHSFAEVGEFDLSQIEKVLIDLKIWLSAVITYQETCLDGFQNTTSHAGQKMKEALKSAMRLSSNSLAIVSDISSVLTGLEIPGLGHRRLLQDLPILGHDHSIPLQEWMNNPGVRRLLEAHPANNIRHDLVVAKDGSGDFKTINEALFHVPKNGNKTFVLYIKEGVYQEYVQINKSMTHLMMLGDGAQKTRITGNKNFIDGTPTFKTSTVAVSGDNFIAMNIGFENTAGPEKHQAVALRVQADMSIFYNCSMDGYQDTLYAHTKRQFYRDCTVSGTIDFVFGDAAAVFQNCTFVVRKPLENQQCIVTAQGRKERRQPTALILQDCTIVADPAFYPVRFDRRAYLGRPWKEFSRTIIMESYIDDLIQPQGWLPWMGDFALRTCFYAEFNNRGPGASLKDRVKWRGIKNITRAHALDFSPGRFVMGDTWIKPIGLPYTSGFTTSEKQIIGKP
ncbi:hypothetical protein F2P56_023807 [Juglans regia]|uniref:Pectinesterase n=2 Tax=Juglans regia TaxID=51240 RepID=A0A833X062_JUGRE|nr:probable pectinesterase/pectinesterase inhibitor 21 [Juglans regia]KAF5454119.1 hypothetical protein F2P56_023807 [Juglans regia]